MLSLGDVRTKKDLVTLTKATEKASPGRISRLKSSERKDLVRKEEHDVHTQNSEKKNKDEAEELMPEKRR